MTIASTTAKSGPYSGNGVTTVFNYGFKVFDEGDLVVTLLNSVGTEVVQTITTEYTVTGVGNDAGGTVVMVTPPATDEQLAITRSVPLVQELDLQNRKAVNPVLIERGLDLVTQMLQDINERVDRSLKIDVFETVDLDALLANVNSIAALASELSTVAGVTTELVTVAGDSADIAALGARTAALDGLAARLLELDALYAIRANIDLVAAVDGDIAALGPIAANISTVAGIAANVTTVAGISGNVTAVANIDAAVTSIAQKYQGAAATDPTVRALDGSALQVGDFYLNTVTDDIRFVTSVGPVVWSELTTLIDESTLTSLGLTEPASAYNAAAALSGRNLIINGSGRINQRGYTSGAATSGANQFTLDRWFVITSGESLTFTGDDSGRVMTAPAGGVRQVVEGANVVGGTYVLNWTGTATATVGGVARTKGETFTLTANTNVTVTFASGTFTDVQLERGSVVTPFEWRSFGQELVLCQRYYQTFNYRARWDASTSGDIDGRAGALLQTMRATPSVASLSPTVVNVASASLAAPNASSYRVEVTPSAAGGVDYNTTLTFSAELTS